MHFKWGKLACGECYLNQCIVLGINSFTCYFFPCLDLSQHNTNSASQTISILTRQTVDTASHLDCNWSEPERIPPICICVWIWHIHCYFVCSHSSISDYLSVVINWIKCSSQSLSTRLLVLLLSVSCIQITRSCVWLIIFTRVVLWLFCSYILYLPLHTKHLTVPVFTWLSYSLSIWTGLFVLSVNSVLWWHVFWAVINTNCDPGNWILLFVCKVLYQNGFVLIHCQPASFLWWY
jgi:hypothetical protein